MLRKLILFFIRWLARYNNEIILENKHRGIMIVKLDRLIFDVDSAFKAGKIGRIVHELLTEKGLTPATEVYYASRRASDIGQLNQFDCVEIMFATDLEAAQKDPEYHFLVMNAPAAFIQPITTPK
ncbi:hypothetical protein A3K29_05350 [Candidatus Collierbacteria bacterium RIFOXYB2_FULL_46_14]|uniref:Uncharacterized protein n=1 Tax=Candidatus Collierbacteria bacterium GW2011_GWA2_46_26 TaxID=1618381 RepID=A0A0G1PKZ1_9BACT|nr:MAG: hypothetical protein UX47_C0004G0046 [Candidatus Collierbacteria bacterium GW2011_GWA2_46_26]OGD73519.1 MAG: hypothetical protein A3K29_05350 [Candidatus Collierbacteria bacterium RIFOXYB2_FULL_46_14]OGD76561.1 MAG: hypothetical protein A3K43_05350 [Candidatus Collierbacteria bacterium RIFOXYA2_FULL_46_20]OGD77897.1 MAG: hypothetical protein A3K39_05350 [Candidatus Collierbacteria bacterium RIFOXYC2_FULL_43_15]OGD81187.1 MAG: hypothetical protein A2320_05845 [Pseudomonadales bacterium G